MKRALDKAFALEAKRVTKLFAKRLVSSPRITGTVTIKNILNAVPIIEIEPGSPPIKWLWAKTTMMGMVITESRLITAVRDMESATSPRANAVNILEVTPPGAAAMIITPSASSGGTSNKVISKKATEGSNKICAEAPIIKSLGAFTTRAKSATVSPSPKENIMKARLIGKIISVTIPIRYLSV